MTPGLLPEGLRDRLPPEAEAAAALVATLLGTLASHGYERVQPPLMEYEESLAGRLANTDRRELLRFIDPVSQRTLALRPDITGQVARIAATRLAHVERPLRLSYAGPVLRVKGSQLTPEREMVQAGAELIGSDSVGAVVEVLRLAVEALTAAGLTGLTVDLTMPSLIDGLASIWPIPTPLRHSRESGDGGGGEALANVRALLDGKDAAGLRAAGAAAYEPLITAAGPAGKALATLRGLALPAAVAAHIDDVASVIAALPAGLPVTLDPTERHGFEYQSWIGFSLFATGVRGEVGRGGSYRVVHEASDERAVGFSLYVDGLVDAGLGRVERRQVWLPFGTPVEAGERLRAEGWVTIAALDADAPVSECSHRWTAAGVEETKS